MNLSKVNRRLFVRIFFKYAIVVTAFVNKLMMGKVWGRTTNIVEGGRDQQNGKPKDSYVLRVFSQGIMNDDVNPHSYLDSINKDELDRMLEKGIKRFTGHDDILSAWLDILSGYKPGDIIAIKPNFNMLNHGYKFTITSPQLINAVIKQLVSAVGVNPEEIYLYDLCKKIPEDIVRNRIDYPINYVERMLSKTILDKAKIRAHYGPASADTGARINMRESIVDSKGKHVQCYIPKVITQAQHVINLPLLSNHIFISNSGALKNHYGTVRFSNYHSFPGILHGNVLNKSISEINNHPQIRYKTRIIIADGLFGVFDRGDGKGKRKWQSLNNDFPKSIFISKDPVAIDSVMAVMILQERKMKKLNLLKTEYLAEAMRNGLGIYENPEKLDKLKNIKYLTVVS